MSGVQELCSVALYGGSPSPLIDKPQAQVEAWRVSCQECRSFAPWHSTARRAESEDRADV
ncbi:hypothetical protein ACPW7J_08875 [Ihubacter sp. rT4E-8]|uniref:hypothetical protein n=1 Tax=Ihubacter sp. rT4E-8 TaxID=3242369 RepID=UPI003CF9B50C